MRSPMPQSCRARLLFSALFAASALIAGSVHAQDTSAPRTAVATFAGGCFWCMEEPFDELEGVVSTTSGYTGGTVANPTYEAVSAGGTRHLEAVQVEYDPARIGFERLLEVFWRNVDPTDDRGQFCDRGYQYTTAIFVHDDAQRAVAELSKTTLAKEKPFRGEIVTPIRPAATFYPAEDYHQNYYQVNSVRYKFYRYRCGRDQRLEALWGKRGSG